MQSTFSVKPSNFVLSFFSLPITRIIYSNGRQPTNRSQLFVICKQAEAQIPDNYIEKLVLSMKRRLLAVIMNGGDLTKY